MAFWEKFWLWFQGPRDGAMLGRVEEIGLGHDKDITFLGRVIIPKQGDMLMISNGKPNLWVLSILTGYHQVGLFEVERPCSFKEGDWLEVVKKADRIVSVEKLHFAKENGEKFEGYA